MMLTWTAYLEVDQGSNTDPRQALQFIRNTNMPFSSRASWKKS